SGWRACASACIRSADGSMSIPWWDARPSRQSYRSGTSKQTESTWIGESLSPPEVQPCGVHRQPRRDLASSPCSKLQNAEKEMASEETVRAEIGPIWLPLGHVDRRATCSFLHPPSYREEEIPWPVVGGSPCVAIRPPRLRNR